MGIGLLYVPYSVTETLAGIGSNSGPRVSGDRAGPVLTRPLTSSVTLRELAIQLLLGHLVETKLTPVSQYFGRNEVNTSLSLF